MNGDELAGVVDLFGALTRSELADALDELAFKRGDAADDATTGEDAAAAVDAAVHEYYLVPVARDDRAAEGGEANTDATVGEANTDATVGDADAEALLAPGPVAFPELPEYGADLPHILDVERRDVARDDLAAAVRDRLEAEAPDADGDRAEYLLDVTYDAEAWAPLDLEDVREELASDS